MARYISRAPKKPKRSKVIIFLNVLIGILTAAVIITAVGYWSSNRNSYPVYRRQGNDHTCSYSEDHACSRNDSRQCIHVDSRERRLLHEGRRQGRQADDRSKTDHDHSRQRKQGLRQHTADKGCCNRSVQGIPCRRSYP